MEELEFDHSWVNGCVLVCPLCGEAYLHHRMIEAFERSEDAAEGIHTIVTHRHVDVKHEDVKYDPLTGNPSPRRHGFTVEFECENCGGSPVMKIYQHKGQTWIGWCD